MAFKALTITKGDRVTLRFQLTENSTAKNITGMTFKFGVKESIADSSYKIGPVDGVIDDAANGKFSFTLTSAHTNRSPFVGVYEIAMYDAGSNRTTLTPSGGMGFKLVENVID